MWTKHLMDLHVLFSLTLKMERLGIILLVCMFFPPFLLDLLEAISTACLFNYFFWGGISIYFSLTKILFQLC